VRLCEVCSKELFNGLPREKIEQAQGKSWMEHTLADEWKPGRRKDARYCSDACRQRAHRKASVTAKKTDTVARLFSRDDLERRILALVEKHRAVFLNDLLPESRTSAEYQAVRSAAAKLEAGRKIGSLSYYARFGKPGFKVLLKPGHDPKKPDAIPRLKASEQLIHNPPPPGRTPGNLQEKEPENAHG
jgi:hypothetical protein